LAFDVTEFNGSQPVWDSPNYKKMGTIGKNMGLTWGGDWKSIVDEPHFELHPSWASDMSESQMLAELRRRHDKGMDAFA
jgi:peptidoglycan L-alanyl-D-glutamate endopeptidase CwlK